jgi:chromosome segregation ATPase
MDDRIEIRADDGTVYECKWIGGRWCSLSNGTAFAFGESITANKTIAALLAEVQRLRQRVDEVEAEADTMAARRVESLAEVDRLREQRDRLREALRKCHDLFSEISCDLTDPRSECRDGRSSTTPSPTSSRRRNAMSIDESEIMTAFDALVADAIKSGHSADKAREIAHATINRMLGMRIELPGKPKEAPRE